MTGRCVTDTALRIALPVAAGVGAAVCVGAVVFLVGAGAITGWGTK